MIENPSKLFVGEQTALHEHITMFIQKKLCTYNACSVCTTCLSIRDRQHYALRWFSPEKTYTREELAPLFHILSFTLNNHEQFFIIIEKADYLTVACANSLLKSLEEPPQGYQFLLLTDRPDQVLPTIRSRCALYTVKIKNTPKPTSALFTIFTTTDPVDPANFLKIIEKEKLTEQESNVLLDQLFTHWYAIYKEIITGTNKLSNYHAIERTLNILRETIQHPPMPGSSKLMLKNLFLHLKQ